MKKPTLFQIIAGAPKFLAHAWPPIETVIRKTRAHESPGGIRVTPGELAAALATDGDDVLRGLADGLVAAGWVR